MTKQEEIRAETAKTMMMFFPAPGVLPSENLTLGTTDALRITDEILKVQDRLGCVLKVDRELPSEYTDMGNLKYGGMMANDILKVGYEPLVEE